jgi:hypothetical protein
MANRRGRMSCCGESSYQSPPAFARSTSLISNSDCGGASRGIGVTPRSRFGAKCPGRECRGGSTTSRAAWSVALRCVGRARASSRQQPRQRPPRRSTGAVSRPDRRNTPGLRYVHTGWTRITVHGGPPFSWASPSSRPRCSWPTSCCGTAPTPCSTGRRGCARLRCGGRVAHRASVPPAGFPDGRSAPHSVSLGPDLSSVARSRSGSPLGDGTAYARQGERRAQRTRRRRAHRHGPSRADQGGRGGRDGGVVRAGHHRQPGIACCRRDRSAADGGLPLLLPGQLGVRKLFGHAAEHHRPGQFHDRDLRGHARAMRADRRCRGAGSVQRHRV